MRESIRPSILVAGIGNIFLGDDGFGCEVAHKLTAMPLMPAIKVIDYGIRGLDLAYALLEPYEIVILVDAIVRGGRPGTVYVLQPANSREAGGEPTTLDPHSMDPVHLMAMARSLGKITAEVFIVGCEPLDFGDELEGRMGLSETMKFSVSEAVRAVVDLADRVHQQKEELEKSLYANR
jgi:hydrogenase maturation protease